MSLSTSKFEILTAVSGETSIRHMGIAETIHPSGPVLEAQNIYINQSLLEEKLQENITAPLVLYDVGLGAAGLTSQVLETWDNINHSRDLEILSFESDLTLLEYALDKIDLFPHLIPHRERLCLFMKEGQYFEQGLNWRLVKGEFSKNIFSELPTPEIIFHDAYSPKKNPEMWDFKIFKRYFDLSLESKASSSTTLVTFSQATHVRASLLAAGFFVGEGVGLGFKRNSTVASTDLSDLSEPLNSSWVEKWLRSPDYLEQKRFNPELITAHFQFKNN